MRFADIGFLDTLTDGTFLKSAGASAAGGAVGVMAWGYLTQKIGFFANEADSDMRLLKNGGAALAIGLLGGAALWEQGEMAQDAAKGMLGGLGAVVGQMLNRRFIDTSYAPRLDGFGQVPTADSIVSLNSLDATRVYEGSNHMQLPAGVGRVRVSDDEALLTQMASF